MAEALPSACPLTCILGQQLSPSNLLRSSMSTPLGQPVPLCTFLSCLPKQGLPAANLSTCRGAFGEQVTYALRPVGQDASLFRQYPQQWKVFVGDPSSVGRYTLAAEMAAPPPREPPLCVLDLRCLWHLAHLLGRGCARIRAQMQTGARAETPDPSELRQALSAFWAGQQCLQDR